MIGRVALAVLLLLSVIVACACDDAAKGAFVAELSGRSGSVDRDFADTQERWSDAQLGARFAMGDGLRTGPTSTARLELSPEGSALVEPSTVVRFTAEAPGERSQHLILEAGGIELTTDQFELVVHTPRAVARLDHRSKVKLWASRDSGPARIEVSVGRASLLRTGEPAATELVAGESRRWAEEPAQSDAPTVTPDADAQRDASAPTVVPIDSEVTARDAAASSAEARARVPEEPPLASAYPFDLRVGVGERAVLHAARMPVLVAVVVPPCAGNSELKVGAQRFTAAHGSVLAKLGQGRHELRFRCADNDAGKGMLTVRRDEARATVAGHPPEVSLALDGRRYQVRHSGSPPVIHVAWPDATGPGPFTLSIGAHGRVREYQSAQAQYTLPARDVTLGPIALSFRDALGNVSRITNVEVSFDESSRLLQWTSPLELSARKAEALVVQGTVLPGARVRVGERELTVLSTGQFRGEVATPPAGMQLVADVMHPLLGRHYYVRRLR